jgi:hypothetical protein
MITLSLLTVQKSKKLSVTEVLNNAEKDNALFNEVKNQIKQV